MDKVFCFLEIIMLGYKSIYGWMTWQTYLLTVILVPFSQTALFSYLNYFIKGPTGMRYAALGNALFTICIFSVFTIGAAITTERRLGTLQLLLLSPVDKTLLLVMKSLLHTAEGVITCAFSLLLGYLCFGLSFTNVSWSALAVVVISTSMAMMGVGVFAGVSGLLFRRSTPVLNAFVLLLFLLCGVNFPVHDLPQALRWIANGLPLTHGIELLRQIYQGHATLLPGLWRLCATGALFLTAGHYLFAFSERRCRRQGSLDWY